MSSAQIPLLSLVFTFHEFADCCLDFFISDQRYFLIVIFSIDFFSINSPGVRAHGILNLLFSFIAFLRFAEEFMEHLQPLFWM